jgi:hypothetical protein
VIPREKGTPQGGVVSPLLANLFLHYALDRWLTVNYPRVPFERYADDVIVHCRTERQAQEVKAAIAKRLQTCGLELHPEKTKIVYCKDDFRKWTYPNEKFDFLGYTFQPRRSKNRRGRFFINFSPAVSNKAAKAIRDTIRSWNLPRRSDKALEDLSRMFNPIIRGWLQYYGGAVDNAVNLARWKSLCRQLPVLPSSQAASRLPGPLRTGRESFPSSGSSPSNASCEETRFRYVKTLAMNPVMALRMK